MKDLIASLSKHGNTVSGQTIKLGEWDIGVGCEKMFYLTNPNTYAKAVLKDIKNKDKRLKLEFVNPIQPEITVGEILPRETIGVKITIKGHDFDDPAQEEDFFKKAEDTIFGSVKWEVP